MITKKEGYVGARAVRFFHYKINEKNVAVFVLNLIKLPKNIQKLIKSGIYSYSGNSRNYSFPYRRRLTN